IINKPFAEISSADFEYVYKVNVFGVAALTRAVLPLMSKGSHVVTISSVGGIQGSSKFPGLAAYSLSKGVVITLIELLAEEYKEPGVSFMVLALAIIKTEICLVSLLSYPSTTYTNETAIYTKDFVLKVKRLFNGKVLEDSPCTPSLITVLATYLP